MQKLLRLLVLTFAIIGFTLPAFGVAEAAKVAVLPIVTNEDEENSAVSRRVWNEVCMEQFKFPDFDMVDDSDLTIVLNEVNYNNVAKSGVNEALMRQVMEKTNADIGVMLVMSEIALEPVASITNEDIYRFTQKGRIMLVNKISGQVKTNRIDEMDEMNYALTVRGDFIHDQLRNTIVRELKRVTKAK
ncbi:MAG: hypothetical protein Q4E64_11185 [Phascolarctobacterium sp.]|uniref:hypothetical protein n=1 Tax=Phascolarctobacterium sp. TaxID=2049039 RepID=UPI0026DCC0A9|nr:hypothetical protein [Phascolarctobacterium sp.]MDO4922372.1 hypothetical protein [Phascolarctobacterium sp.]